MPKSISELIKEVRVSHNLTQREFANKFYVTEKTISNYENGMRNPSLEFLSTVCDEFNLTLDFFMERARAESKSKDLVVTEKNGKYAIYDTKQSVYLTQHIYDTIKLSKYGRHIVYKRKNYFNENGECFKNGGDFSYSALVDNNANITEFPNLIIGAIGGFDVYGTCIAYNKRKDKYYLINYNGEKLSQSFEYMKPVDSECFGLYLVSNDKITDEDLNATRKKCLMYADGSVITGTILYEEDNWEKLKDLENEDVLKSYLEKYGPNLLRVATKEVLQKGENYQLMLNAVLEYAKANKEIGYEILSYSLSLLLDYADKYSVKTEIKLEVDNLRLEDYGVKNKFAQNEMKKQLDKFINKLG